MKPKINPFWGILTAMLAVLTLVLCVIGSRVGVVYVRTEAKPEDTVERFFNALEVGKYEEAYACLENVSGLGLEHSPRTEEGKQELAALLASYTYTLEGEALVKRDTATQTVRLRYLDLTALEEARNTPLTAEGEEPSEEAEAVFPTMEELLAHVEDYYITTQLTVTLDYADGQWLIEAEPNLLTAIAGGKG